MRRWIACLLILLAAGIAPGCGGGGGLEAGMPKDLTPPPKDFDPAGGVVPDMTGKSSPRKAVPKGSPSDLP